MDIDAVLARRPDLALVDELAHTNIPARHHRHPGASDVAGWLNARTSAQSSRVAFQVLDGGHGGRSLAMTFLRDLARLLRWFDDIEASDLIAELDAS